jgi:hypothetical protein
MIEDDAKYIWGKMANYLILSPERQRIDLPRRQVTFPLRSQVVSQEGLRFVCNGMQSAYKLPIRHACGLD